MVIGNLYISGLEFGHFRASSGSQRHPVKVKSPLNNLSKKKIHVPETAQYQNHLEGT